MTIPAYLVWVVVANLAIYAICKVVLIGAPREPITNGQAAWSVLTNCVLIVLLVLRVTG